MDSSKQTELKAHVRAIAQLLYAETESTCPEQLENFEGIEQAVRDHLIEHVGPEIGEFFVKAQAPPEAGGAARLKDSSAMSSSAKVKRKR